MVDYTYVTWKGIVLILFCYLIIKASLISFIFQLQIFAQHVSLFVFVLFFLFLFLFYYCGGVYFVNNLDGWVFSRFFFFKSNSKNHAVHAYLDM